MEDLEEKPDEAEVMSDLVLSLCYKKSPKKMKWKKNHKNNPSKVVHVREDACYQGDTYNPAFPVAFQVSPKDI